MKLISRIVISALFMFSASVSAVGYAQTQPRVTVQSAPPTDKPTSIEIKIQVPEYVPVYVNTNYVSDNPQAGETRQQTGETGRQPEYAGSQTRNNQATSPKWAIKSNLLYDATATINLGAEMRLGYRTSLDASFNYNGWSVKGYNWTHFMVQPEFRWWPKESFRGHFFGVHALYASYDLGSLPASYFSETISNQRIDGWLLGVGLSYGYRLGIGRRWALEGTLGAGFVYMMYDKYENFEDEQPVGLFKNNYFGPTKLGISLVYNIGIGKGAPRTRRISTQADNQPVTTPVYTYNPVFAPSFVVPERESVRRRSESGNSYLDFATGSSTIVERYKNNAFELQRMHETIRTIISDPNAKITNISIIGHTSPEGTYDHNRTLSQRRAQSLKDYIRRTYGLPDYMFTVTGEGEDWATLEQMVENSYMAYKDWILEIIRNVGIFNGREKMLMDMAGGVPYRQMKAEFFPRLRRTEYRIDYTLPPFDVENGKETLRRNPSRLSLYEMFAIADSYARNSDSARDVFLTAASIYPDDDTANLNAAASALTTGDWASAVNYLDKVKGRPAEYWNNYGIALWLRGDKAGAADSFARAGSAGAANASELQKHMAGQTVR